MSKFKVGDIIVGNECSNTYGYTSKKNNFVGEVIEIRGTQYTDDITVKILNCDYTDAIGLTFDVQSKYFELQNRKGNNMKKTMNRLEMINKLAENPKRKGKLNSSIVILDKGGCFVWEDTGEFVNCTIGKDEYWEIIEPTKELKEMSFVVAYKMYYTLIAIESHNIKSVITGLDFSRGISNITCEELEGKWTIEGVYEDDK